MNENSSSFDPKILQRAGLTDSQARGYLALVEYGQLTPNQLAERTGESRTNSYQICDKLVSLGLASKNDSKKATYIPSHPSAIESLAERRRKVVINNEKFVKQNISPLIDIFYAHTEMPGTRTFQGVDGIKEVYTDTLRIAQDIYLVRTTADAPSLGEGFFSAYRSDRAKKGITTYAITPNTIEGREHSSSGDDQKMRYIRTFIPVENYTAPVEIDVYGNKVALISFGETQMATVIDSQPIASALKQICQMIITSHREYSQHIIDSLGEL